MTDQQIIERLAVEMMGWEPYDSVNEYHGRSYTSKYWKKPDGFSCGQSAWNPLNDWNHWRQVEETLFDKQELWQCFCLNVFGYYASRKDYGGAHLYAKADLPTRCKALIAALDSLKGV